MKLNKNNLEKLYAKYNRREFVHPDPLEFLYDYKNVRDREIVALIASSLAYGRVRQILKSVAIVLDHMKPSPSAYLKNSADAEIHNTYKNFKHRFTTGEDISWLLIGIKSAIENHGSLEKCFLAGLKTEHDTIMPALSLFALSLRATNLPAMRAQARLAGGSEAIPRVSWDCRALRARNDSLIPSPEKKSACKRLNLFLRWMVRHDRVDPGGWTKVPAHRLVVPLDTHMHRIARQLGLTKRKQANLKTAIEITEAFAKISPEDPVKYDFVLTRFGIRNDLGKLPPLCKGRIKVG